MAKGNRVNTESLFKSMMGRPNTPQNVEPVEAAKPAPLATAPEATAPVATTPEAAAPGVTALVAAAPGVTAPVAEEPPVKCGRKARPKDEQTIQVSFYPTRTQAKELKIQVAEGGKENDKSALARTAFDIVLTLSDEEYREMKATAEMEGTTPGQIVKEALQLYFSSQNK